MGAGATRQQRRLDEAIDRILTIREGDPPIAEQLTGTLLPLFGADVDHEYSLRFDGRFGIDHLVTSGGSTAERALFLRGVEKAGTAFSFYDPRRPQREQRNRALSTWDMLPPGAKPPPIVEVIFGFGVTDNLRVLLCDGPALVSNFGFFRRGGRFGRRDRAMLQALVEPLNWRLRAESALANGTLWLAALQRSLDAMGTPAMLVDASGKIVLANAPAFARTRADRRALGEAIADAVRGRPSTFRVSAIEAPGQARHFLLVEPAAVGSVAARMPHAQARWRLTVRQAEVLAEIAEGRANKTIAAVLGCTEATVEAHVTALLEKAQAESRAELIAQFWRGC